MVLNMFTLGKSWKMFEKMYPKYENILRKKGKSFILLILRKF